MLFSPRTELYFGLNETGASIWELLRTSHDSLEQVCEILGRRYPGVPLDTLRADVDGLLEQLLTEGLVIAPGLPAWQERPND